MQKTKSTKNEDAAPDGKKSNTASSGIVDALRAFGVLSGIGIYLVVFLGIFIFIGKKADDILGTGRVCTILGILLGFPAAGYSIYRQLKAYKIV